MIVCVPSSGQSAEEDHKVSFTTGPQRGTEAWGSHVVSGPRDGPRIHSIIFVLKIIIRGGELKTLK